MAAPAPEGRLYELCVRRPLAERLIDLLGVRPGERCADLPCRGGALSVALARATGPAGSVCAVDGDAAARAACRAALDALGLGRVRVLPAADARLASPVDEARRADDAGEARGARHAGEARGASHAGEAREPCGFDVVASLLTLALDAAPAERLSEAASLVGPGGRLGVATWAGPAGAPHLEVLGAVLRDALGVPGEPLAAELALGAPGASRSLAHRACDGADAAASGAAALLREAEEVHVRDVLRFDGPEHVWAACVTDRPALAGLVAALGPGAPGVALVALRERLAEYAAADGTLRIPVELAVLVGGPRRGR